jgi:alpha-1,2-mannosyltransferase
MLQAIQEKSPTPSAARVAALFCAICGLYGWAQFVMIFIHDGLIGPQFYAVGTDWMVYYAGVKAFLHQNLPLVFDAQRFTAYQNDMFASLLPRPLSFRPWLYPPDYLLLLLPFGLLPFALALGLFEASTFAAVAASLLTRRIDWRRSVALLLSPAACLTVIAGQNAFLSAALMIGGFRLLPRRPILAGILLGVLTYKPQLWILVPVALVAGRRWRALAAAAVTAVALVLTSMVVLGVEPWRLWLAEATNAPGEFYASWLQFALLHGFSPYVCALLLGASTSVATMIEVIASLGAVASVYWAYRRARPNDLQLAILLAATMLAAPHVQSYDMVLLAAAVLLCLPRVLKNGFLPGEMATLGTVWILPWMQPIIVPVARVAPILIGLVVIYAIARAAAAPETSNLSTDAAL